MCAEEQTLQNHLNEMEGYINAADNICLSLIDKKKLIIKAIVKMKEFSLQPCIISNPSITFMRVINIGRKLEYVMQQHNIYVSLKDIAVEAIKTEQNGFVFGNICY